MTNEVIKTRFLDAAEEWICDGYSLDIRYLATVDQSKKRIWSALIDLRPLPAPKDLGFRIDSSLFAIGQIQTQKENKKSLLRVLSRATSGAIELPEEAVMLPDDQALDFYSEMLDRDRWFGELHLHVSGGAQPVASALELGAIDNVLRRSQPPFDGLSDAAAWLGVSASSGSTNRSSIALRVGPPVDLFNGVLTEDILTLTLHAHPKFDVSRIGLAVRAVPGNFLDTRKQVADGIKWKRVQDGRRSGVVKIQLEHADNALMMLVIGDSTVRRQWFIDPHKARNNRLLAVQHFDADLKMVKEAVLEASDSKRFENGIAALLFVLGFNPCLQIETNAPDLVVSTPQGKLVIVECTTRIADFASKVGELVDRRGALSKYLTLSGTNRKLGTIVHTTLTANDPAGLLPLQEALGYDLAQSLFAQERNLVMEGLTDYWYVEATAALLREASVVDMNEKIALVPAGSAGKVVYYATILHAQKLKVAALLDSDAAGEQAAQQEELVHTLGNKNILRTKDSYSGPVGKPEIEEMLRETLIAVAKDDLKWDVSKCAGTQPSRSIVDIFSAEIADFSKYKLAKAYLRWTRSHSASELAAGEAQLWKDMIEKINNALG